MRERLTGGKKINFYGPPRYLRALDRMAELGRRKRADMLRECVRREALRQGIWEGDCKEGNHERT